MAGTQSIRQMKEYINGREGSLAQNILTALLRWPGGGGGQEAKNSPGGKKKEKNR